VGVCEVSKYTSVKFMRPLGMPTACRTCGMKWHRSAGVGVSNLWVCEAHKALWHVHLTSFTSCQTCLAWETVLGVYLEEEIQVGSPGEHLEEEYGQKGDHVVLGCLDSVVDVLYGCWGLLV
jgi:hypothetical protein